MGNIFCVQELVNEIAAKVKQSNQFPKYKEHLYKKLKAKLIERGRNGNFGTEPYTRDTLTVITDLLKQFDNKLSEQEVHSWLFPGHEFENLRESKNDSLGDPIEDYNENQPTIDFVQQVYKNTSMTNIMMKDFESLIVRKLLVDLENEKEIIGDSSTLNDKIKDVQEELYRRLYSFIVDTLKVENLNLPENLFGTDRNALSRLKEFFANNSDKELRKFDTLDQDVLTLNTWRMQKLSGNAQVESKIQAYNAYFLLKHFDSMLQKTFGTLIQWETGTKDKIIDSKSKYRYDFDDDPNKIEHWQQEDLQQKSAFDLIPKSMQLFIRSCPIINSDTGLETGTYLSKEHITFFTQKIKVDFRNPEYNTKPFVVLKTFAKRLEEMTDQEAMEALDFDPDMIDLDTINEIERTHQKKSGDSFKLQLVKYFRKQPESDEYTRELYFEELVNKIRINPDKHLKMLFDARKALNKEMAARHGSTIENRVFDNLYRYFFAGTKSLFCSSYRMYSQITSLFDTTSIVEYSQYRINEDGSISVRVLSPKMLDENLSKMKERINSAFFPGECDEFIERYGAQAIEENVIQKEVDGEVVTSGNFRRSVEFYITKLNKDRWKIQFNCSGDKVNRWTISYQTYKGDNNYEEKPIVKDSKNLTEIYQFTEFDFNSFCPFFRDILQENFLPNNPELRTALLDQFKDVSGQHNYDIATRKLLDITIPIFSNVVIFRKNAEQAETIKSPSSYDTDVAYTVREENGETFQYRKVYLTENDKPYTLVDETGKELFDAEGKPRVDVNKIFKTFGTNNIMHITKEQLKEYQNKGWSIGILSYDDYRTAINNWFGDNPELNINYRYQGVDLISGKTSYNLEPVVEAITLVRGETFKSMVRTAERTNLTIGQSSMLMSEKFARLEEYSKNVNPMSIMWKELKSALRGYTISREGENGGTSKQNKDFNFKENFHSNFIIDFLLPVYMGADWNPRFTEGVYSDKPPVNKINIDVESILSTDGAKSKIKETFGDAYRKIFFNIKEDFDKVRLEYEKTGKVIPLKIEDNFSEYNNWCEHNGLDPFKTLTEMVLHYNKLHKQSPIPFAENLHYHINRKSNRLELPFAFIEGLTRFTVDTKANILERKKTLEERKNKEKIVKEKRYLQELLSEPLFTDDDFIGKWNNQVISLIEAENTQQQLGSDYISFHKRFENQDGFIDVLSKGFLQDNYDTFIHNSNLEFISKLLKNEAVVDLQGLEGSPQLQRCIKGIFKNLPEWKKILDSTVAKTKAGNPRLTPAETLSLAKDEVEKQFRNLWFTARRDRLVFGVVEVENDKGEYELATEEEVSRYKDEKQRQIVETRQVPVKLASREDLAQLRMTDANGNEVKFYESDFNLNSLNLTYRGKKARIKVNPILEQFNLNSFLWSSLSSFTTVGTHYWSDAKGKTNTLAEESLKWFDNNKRNVAFSATKLQFKLGDIWGVPTYAKVAVIDDIIAICSGIMGDSPTIKPYDGATFTSMFMHYLENNSLNRQITGYTKKPIYSFYQERYLAGGLGKTANFALNNEKIRNSLWGDRMAWKMSSGEWEWPEDATNRGPIDIDLTLGLRELNENLGLQGLTRYSDQNGRVHMGPTYIDYIGGRKVIKEIVGFKKVSGINKYEVTTRLIDPTKKMDEVADPPYMMKDEHYVEYTQTLEINNNYRLWKTLGGFNSVEFNPTTKQFEFSENSCKTVADWMAKIRFVRNTDGTYRQELYNNKDERFGNRFTYYGDNLADRDDSTHYCPLKEAEIAYIVTKGAMKKFAANVNSKAEYETDKELNFFKMDMYEAGIQLDPTHDATEHSVVSMMTQVISALSERGFTHTIAQEVYEALAELTSLAIADNMKVLDNIFKTKDRSELQVLVSKLIVDEFLANKQSSSSGTNMARIIAERLMVEGLKGETLTFKDTQGKFPFSDPAMFGLLQTTITSAINKRAIKTKLFGSLAVLNPSYEIQKFYGDRRLSEIENLHDLERIQNDLKPVSTISDIELGKTYTINIDKDIIDKSLDQQLITINTAEDYYLWKIKLAGLRYTLKETIYQEGKIYDQGDTEAKRQAIKSDNGQFNFYKVVYESGLEETKRFSDIFEFKDRKDNPIKYIQKINLYGRNLGSYNIHMDVLNGDQKVRTNRYDLKVVQDSVLHPMAENLKTFFKVNGIDTNVTKEQYFELVKNNWNLIYPAYKIDPLKLNLYQEVGWLLKDVNTEPKDKILKEKILQEQLLSIKDFKSINIYDSNLNDVNVQVKDYNIKKYEAILPKIYTKQFGLRPGDSVAKILQDEHFFFARILENYIGQKAPSSTSYDVCFKRSDGKHVYVKYSPDPKSLLQPGIERLNIVKFTNDYGTFRMDSNKPNQRLYPLSNKSDEVFYDREMGTEIIVTNKLDFYLKNLNYINIEFGDLQSEETRKVVLEALKSPKSQPICKYIYNQIKNSNFTKYLEQQKKQNKLILDYINIESTRAKTVKKLKVIGPQFYNLILALSRNQQAAFKTSLDFVVARIPAQGMQSFMAMEIVGFSDSDANDCYVSTEQIRLQGSDYDVDKATFMGFAFNKAGCFVKWSPFFQENSYEKLQESMDYLPYPTGRTIKIEAGKSNSIDFEKYRDLFYKKNQEEKKEVQEKTEEEIQTELEAIDREETSEVVLEETEAPTLQEAEEEINNEEEVNEGEEQNKQPKNLNKLFLKGRRDTHEQQLLGELLYDVKRIQEDFLKNKRKYDKEIILTYDDKDSNLDIELVKAIQNIVNKHNKYINTVGTEERANLLKNFVSHKTGRISQNPANALVGGIGVDVTAQDAKDLGETSHYGARPEDSKPGDSSIMYLALNQNHTGKGVIGITASGGMKCFHAMTQAYNNAIANSPNIRNLEFDVKIYPKSGIQDEIKDYRFLADAYLGSGSEEEIIESLKSRGITHAEEIYRASQNRREHAGSNDSAIMTLATDNAKELKLDRLNAGQDLASLYLYGISIGMELRDIFNIMTSTTAQALSRLIKSNLFSSPSVQYLREAIDFIASNDKSLPGIRIAEGTLADMAGDFEYYRQYKMTGFKDLVNINSLTDLYKMPDPKNPKEYMSLKDTVIQVTLNGEFPEYINRLNAIKKRIQINKNSEKVDKKKRRGDILKQGYSYDELKAKRQIENVIKYVTAIHEIVDSHIRQPNSRGLIIKDGVKTINGDLWADLKNISTLEKGEKEQDILRSYLSLNQGQKTKSTDLYKFYDDFCNVFRSKIRDASKDWKEKYKDIFTEVDGETKYRIDFEKFFLDLNYRDRVIRAYEEVKQSINPLWVVTNVPHFNQYLTATYNIYKESRVSIKDRMMSDTILPYITDTLRIRSKREMELFETKAMRWIDSLLSNAFLREDRRFIEIPAGNKIFKRPSNNESPVEYEIFDHPTYIELGTDEGNETFRHWMNYEVIPRLSKQGLTNTPGISQKPKIQVTGIDGSRVNTFLRDIKSGFSNQTPTRNNIKVYSLPIDAIPKSDTENDEQAKYKADFYELRNHSYYVSEETSYPITDLFFYYNLINFQNRSGGKSLTPMFETFISSGTDGATNRYRVFVANMDTDYEFLLNRDYTEEMLQLAMAPANIEYSVQAASAKELPYIYYQNKQTLKFELWKHINPENEDVEISEYGLDYMARNNYQKDKRKTLLENYLTINDEKFSKKKGFASTEVNGKHVTFDWEFDDGGMPKSLTLGIPNKDGLMGKIHISKDEIQKYMKVAKDKSGAYVYRLNPISLAIKASSLIRENCKQ